MILAPLLLLRHHSCTSRGDSLRAPHHRLTHHSTSGGDVIRFEPLGTPACLLALFGLLALVLCEFPLLLLLDEHLPHRLIRVGGPNRLPGHVFQVLLLHRRQGGRDTLRWLQ